MNNIFHQNPNFYIDQWFIEFGMLICINIRIVLSWTTTHLNILMISYYCVPWFCIIPSLLLCGLRYQLFYIQRKVFLYYYTQFCIAFIIASFINSSCSSFSINLQFLSFIFIMTLIIISQKLILNYATHSLGRVSPQIIFENYFYIIFSFKSLVREQINLSNLF